VPLLKSEEGDGAGLEKFDGDEAVVNCSLPPNCCGLLIPDCDISNGDDDGRIIGVLDVD
jgi:hypothetical protein